MLSADFIKPNSTVSLIFDNSDRNMIEKVAFSVQCLSARLDEVFHKLSVRIECERDRVGNAKLRIKNCQKKVDSIRGSRKAITVFSGSHFPPIDTIPQFSVFDENNLNSSEEMSLTSAYIPEINHVESFLNLSKLTALDFSLKSNDTIQELAVRNKSMSDYQNTRVELLMKEEGLGPIPVSISTVGSLLLFNSDNNPYRNYLNLDNLISASNLHGKENYYETIESKGIANAPVSIISGDILPDVEGLDLTFKPQITTLAALPLPSNLPLDFLADLNYSGSSLNYPPINPSSRTRPGGGSSLPTESTGNGNSNSSLPNINQSLPTLSVFQPIPMPSPQFMATLPAVPVSVAGAVSGPEQSGSTLPPPPPLPPSILLPLPKNSSLLPTLPLSDHPRNPVMTLPPNNNSSNNNNNHSHQDITLQSPTAASLPPQKAIIPPDVPSLNSSLLASIRTSSIKALRPSTKSGETGGAGTAEEKRDRARRGEDPEPVESDKSGGGGGGGVGSSSSSSNNGIRKPLSMMDEMKERMARRNRAISGRPHDTTETKPSLPSMVPIAAPLPNLNKPISNINTPQIAVPPVPPPITVPVIAPIMPRKSFAESIADRRVDDDDDDSSVSSTMSRNSFHDKISQVVEEPILVAPSSYSNRGSVRISLPSPVKQQQPEEEPPLSLEVKQMQLASAQIGLLDASRPVLQNLISAAQSRDQGSVSGSDDDEWDDDDDDDDN